MTAAPILGILCSIGLFILCYLYARYAENKARKKGEDFTFPVGIDPARYEVKDRAELPAAWKAFLPMIVLVAIIIVGGIWIKDAPMLTVIAMIIAAILTYVLNYDKLKSISIKQLLNKGLGDGITAIGGLAGVVAFGAVVSNSAAFQDVVKWVLNVNMNPYWKGIFAVAIIAGITGSSSGGLRIMYTNMAEYFKGLAGINLSTLHRLTSVAAGSLDSLPHSSGIFLMLSYLGLSHKEGYKHMFWTTVVIPAIVVVVATLIVTLFGFGAPAVPVVTPVV